MTAGRGRRAIILERSTALESRGIWVQILAPQFLRHVHGLRVVKEELAGLRRDGKVFQAENPAVEAPAEPEGMTLRRD